MEEMIEAAMAQISRIPSWKPIGHVSAIQTNTLKVKGLSESSHIGDQVSVSCENDQSVEGEVIQISQTLVTVFLYDGVEKISLGAEVVLHSSDRAISPARWWVGRIVDPFGQPLDGQSLLQGKTAFPVHAAPPPANARSALGARVNTGLAVLNTILPIVQGQRVGLFAGSGVGKSSLLAALCRKMEADIIVVAMIGERGREVRQFVEEALGPDGMSRAIVVAATADQSALLRRRCPEAAMAIAEYFQRLGKNVLFLADSVTRFAEAHREIALAMGELPTLRGYPASVSHSIMSLCERAGPGLEGHGGITAIFTVLVAGSDLEEPISDILRSVLDGHIILDRDIAERGRYPAINVSKSVSRSLPKAASAQENAMLIQVRRLLGAYENAEIMLKAGLYVEGSDPVTDRAVRVWDELDQFFAKADESDVSGSFDKLNLILRRAGLDQVT